MWLNVIGARVRVDIRIHILYIYKWRKIEWKWNQDVYRIFVYVYACSYICLEMDIPHLTHIYIWTKLQMCGRSIRPSFLCLLCSFSLFFTLSHLLSRCLLYLIEITHIHKHTSISYVVYSWLRRTFNLLSSYK